MKRLRPCSGERGSHRAQKSGHVAQVTAIGLFSCSSSMCRSTTVATARDEGDKAMNSHDLVRQLTGWRQTTAEILYRMPDHPALVQTFLWQDMDRWHDDPRLTYPRLRSFCEWWNANLEGPIVEVRVAAVKVVTAGELRHVDAEIRLH
jgi:uncharacterized protein Usg